MRDVKYMESAADFPKHVSKTSQVLDEELLVDFIKNHKEIIQEVYVGMAEDWSCSNPYWTRNEGFGDRKYLVLKSIWATPTAEVIFTCGRENFVINANEVEELFLHCLFKSDEVIDGKPTIDPIVVQGINFDFGLHPDRLESIREPVKEILKHLPAIFKEGMSFLNLSTTDKGIQWTDSHQRSEQLMVLALACRYMEYTLNKEYWFVLPGGMPYLLMKI